MSGMKRAFAVGAAIVGGGLAAVAVCWVVWAWWESRLPATYSVMDYAIPDDGGGPATDMGMAGMACTRPPSPSSTGRPVCRQRRFTLTAEHAEVRLASGRTVEALTFNRTVPGPELRVHQGDLVEVTLRNKDVKDGVTIHWHGVDLPNAEDGVAGVTQDAVLPGASYVYRFRATQVGTFWYHAHQASASEVRRGLYGALVIEPATNAAPVSGRGADIAVAVHTLNGTPLVNSTDGVEKRAVAPGTPVRLRVINTDSTPQRYDIGGTPFKVVAIDGTDLVGPTPLRRPDARPRRRRPLRHRVHDATDTRQARRRGHDHRAGAEPGRNRRSAAASERAGVRPGRVRPPCADAVRRLEPLRPHVRARRRPQAGVPRRQAGDAVVDQRRHLPARADVHGRGGRPRPDLDRQHDERGAPDAPPRPSHARAQPRRQARLRQPLVERHAQRRAGREATRSPSARTTPASGWTTATT